MSLQEYRERMVSLLSEIDNVEAVGQFHKGMMYDEVTVYLTEPSSFSIFDIGGDGYYRIIHYNHLEPAVELEIKRYPTEQ